MNKHSGFYLLALFLIPVLNALSWLLGGSLLSQYQAYDLAALRTIAGAVVLAVVFILLKGPSQIHRLQRKGASWWAHQLVLAITGRAVYYYYSTKAMVTISSIEAIILTTLIPIMALAMGWWSKSDRLSLSQILFGVAACAASIYSIQIYSGSAFFQIQIGHIEMTVAAASFAFYTVYYKAKIKDDSPLDVLLVQFLFATILMFPLLEASPLIAKIVSLSTWEWTRLLFYTVVCGVAPFVLLHYCLKKYTPFTVLTFSILSPLFAVALNSVYERSFPSVTFLVWTGLTCLLATLTLKKDKSDDVPDMANETIEGRAIRPRLKLF